MAKKSSVIKSFVKLGICLSIALGSGCHDRWRYHCQNPENWNNEDCKPPICVATQTCPEYFNKPTNGKAQDN